MKHEEGVCPVCNRQDLIYHKTDVSGGIVNFVWECNKCFASGLESYDLHFVKHFNIVDEHGKEVVQHECQYCGHTTDSDDPRVLCKECREDFGHTFIDEL